MGVYKDLKDNSIYIGHHCSISNDNSLFFDISEAIPNSELVLKSVLNMKPEMLTIDHLSDYFIIKRIASFIDGIKEVKDDKDKGIVKTLSEAANELLKKYDVGSIIKFINENYKSLIGEDISGLTTISEQMQALFFPLVEFCVQYQLGISDSVFLYLAENKWFVFFNYFDNIRKKLFSSYYLFVSVFSNKNIKKMISTHCERLLHIGKAVNISSSIGEEYKSNMNDLIFSAAIEIMNTTIERDTIVYCDGMRRIRRYFSEINYDKHKLIELEKSYELFDNKLSAWMDKKGSSFYYKIPNDIAGKLFDSDVEWIAKLLLCTHSFNGTQIHSQFTSLTPAETSFIDIVSHNIDTDEYFTMKRQKNIEIVGSIGSALILQVFSNQEYLCNLIEWTSFALQAIAKQCKFNNDEVMSDYIAIIQSLQFVYATTTNDSENYGKSLVYGSCMLIISNIEKTLRKIYKMEKEIVLSDELIQLGGLLSNSEIESIITTDLMKGVGFYLSKYGHIGHNYRNRLAHLSELSINEISTTLPFLFYYLYLCVVNGIFIHYCTDYSK